MGCQKEIAAKIVGGGGEYVLAVKENQPHLYEDIKLAFDAASRTRANPGSTSPSVRPKGPRKGRQETRTCCVITDPKGIRDAGLWTGLTAICMVISERVVNGVAGSETRYFIGSVSGTAEDVSALGARSLGDRELAALDLGRMFPRGRPTASGREQAPRTCRGSASWHCVCSKRRRTVKARVSHTRLVTGVEKRLSVECTGSNPREIDCSGRKQREILVRKPCRSGQGRQVCFTPTFDSSWLS